MGGTPIWLYDAFGVLVLVVAGYSLVLFGTTVGTSQTAGWDVDVAHLLMGVSMAGMFRSSWAFGPRSLWESIFVVVTVWFLARGMSSVRRYGIHLSHFFIHAVLGVAMFLMYRFPVPANGPSMGTMHMAMPMPTGARLGSGISLILAGTFFASAVFTIGSSQKGISHHGRHGLVYAGASPASAPQSRLVFVERLVATPWVEDASHVAMCVSMGFLLVLLS